MGKRRKWLLLVSFIMSDSLLLLYQLRILQMIRQKFLPFITILLTRLLEKALLLSHTMPLPAGGKETRFEEVDNRGSGRL